MSTLFNYKTLKVSLKQETRTLVVSLNRFESSNKIDTEMINELETLFNWASNHLEIHSILLTGEGSLFSEGLDYEDFSQHPEKQVVSTLSKLQKVIYSMFFLPQTIIIDLKEGAKGVALELAAGADIRVAQKGAILHFNHLNEGIAPMCGGVGFLGEMIPKAMAKNWILSSIPITESSLTGSGFLLELYDEGSDELISYLLENISLQAPVQRIQAKRSMLESIMPGIDRALEYEKTFAVAGMACLDWRKALYAKNTNTNIEFTNPRALASHLKKQKNAALKQQANH
ncbi:MAG: enoyl-CoA hydratase/isomerase family protein [Bacteriovoracaceae bacterium]|nr:enoyl-CoA hydratase/isomerase family protein [Bacteriovoracaceae bacterium]